MPPRALAPFSKSASPSGATPNASPSVTRRAQRDAKNAKSTEPLRILCVSFAVVALPSIQAVEGLGTFRHDAAPGFCRQAFELSLDHVGRAGEEPIRVRVVGRPHDLIWADIIGE